MPHLKAKVFVLAGAAVLAQAIPSEGDLVNFVKQEGPLGVLCIVVWLFLRAWAARDDAAHAAAKERDEAWREHSAARDAAMNASIARNYEAIASNQRVLSDLLVQLQRLADNKGRE